MSWRRREREFPLELAFGHDTWERAEQPEYLISPYVREGGFTVLFGNAGTGKSLIALAWALQISQGLSHVAGGYYPHGPGRKTLYLWGEGVSGMGARVRAAYETYWPDYRREDDRHPGRLVNDSFAAIPVGFSIPTNEEAQEVLELVEDNQVGLVVIDTLARYMRGDENNQEDMRTFVNWCGELQALGATVLVVHHTPKGTPKSMRGSTVLRAAADTAILLEQKGERPNHYLVMSSDKDKEGPGFAPVELGFNVVSWAQPDPNPTLPDRVFYSVGLVKDDDPTRGAPIDWALRFAEVLSEPVERKEDAVRAITGKSDTVRAKWAEFENLGWVCKTESGYEWRGPEPVKELW